MTPETRLRLLEQMIHHLMNEVRHLATELVDVLKVVEEMRKREK